MFVSHHFRFNFSRNLFSCRRKIASVKSLVCGSLSCKASASPLAVVKPETEIVIDHRHIHEQVKSELEPIWPAPISSFCNIKKLVVFLLPRTIDGILVHPGLPRYE